jgi:hypothetical protein
MISSTARPSGNFPNGERAMSAACALLLSAIAQTPASVIVTVAARNGVAILDPLDIVSLPFSNAMLR